jgi:4-oxalocrotonate tautomerase
MPLVRISHVAGKSEAHRRALSHGVHQALVEAFGIVHDDYFQIITEHAASIEMVGPKYHLGLSYSVDLVMIQITATEGRTVAQKKALYAGIAERLSREPGIRREDVIISIIDVKPENWSFGNGVAQYAG